MALVREAECEAAGLDPEVVQRIARRLERVARDAAKEGILIFGGSGFGLLAPIDAGSYPSRLRLAELDGGVWDGGDGGEVANHEGLSFIE